jgi:hypothetical protein
MEHYRCYQCYITATQAERVSDTVEFFPSDSTKPRQSPHEAAIVTGERLTTALNNTVVPVDDNTQEAVTTILRQLADINNIAPALASPRVATVPAEYASTRLATLPPHGASPRVAMEPAPVATRTRSATATAINLPQGWANAVMHPITGVAMEYRQLITDPLTKEAWQLSAANEFGRLAQGVGGRIKGTDTIKFIRADELPADRQPTYPRFVCTERPHKEEKFCTQMTVGRNLIDYPGDVSVATAKMETIKLLFNGVVSTPGAKFCLADVTNFYLNTPTEQHEFVRIPFNLIPDEIVAEYDLHKLVDMKGFVLVRVEKGMYGLPQAGILADKLLQARLGPHGYHACKHTPGLWRHNNRPIMFTLVVDDFSIHYEGKEHAQHLIAALKQSYEAVTTDWDSTLFCGITLGWDYKARTVDLSMPGYVDKAMREFQHPPPTKPEHQPHRHNEPQYGVKLQMTDPVDLTAPLSEQNNKLLQKITGKFLFYVRAVDPTMLVTLSALASKQTKGTEQTMTDAVKFLNYCATHPDAVIRYTASDMILRVHSDASYLSEAKARSCAGGLYYMGPADIDNADLNSAVLTSTSIMKPVLSSASEAEIGALFDNCKKATILRTTLHEMGWQQPPTPIQTDNSTACGIANDNIRQQRSRAIDMRFYWVRDRSQQGHFNIFWKPGTTNCADYFTKHHPARHHQLMRPIYLHVPGDKANSAIAHALSILQGCVKPAPGRRHARPNAELESQNTQRETRAGMLSQREERWRGNGMNNGEPSLRIRATAHS